MKLVDMKMSTEERKSATSTPVKDDEGPRYPWGLQITFDGDEIDKIPELKDVKVGDTIILAIEGTVKTVSLREEDDESGEKRSVTFQGKKVGVTNQDDFEGAFMKAAGGKGH